MNTKLLLTVVLAVVVVGGGMYLLGRTNQQGAVSNTTTAAGTTSETTSNPTATPPLPKPPTSNSKGSISGKVSVVPLCNIIANPPQAACLPQPFQTTINVYTAGTNTLITSVQSDASGNYSLPIAAGTYELRARENATTRPFCSVITVTAASNVTTQASAIYCRYGYTM